MSVSRRRFLRGLLGAPLLGAPLAGVASACAGEPRRRPRIAVIYTVCFHRSHAHVILENLLTPYLFNGRLTQPSVDVVALWADQRSRNRNTPDLTDEINRRFKVPVFNTIADALTLGGKALAVDGVLSIGEHGDYPTNKDGVREYPRKRFFDEAIAVMRRSDRFVPFFNDKHLSYRWDWAKEMYDVCQKHRIPLMAGSSVPLSQRRPPLELPANAVIEEAVSIHGGPFESYDFHGLEVLHALIEARRGGETGVSHVEFLEGDALFQAARQGRWSLDLARAAMRAELGDNVPDITRPINNAAPHGILLTLRDGTKATMLKLGASATRWNFACKLAGENEHRATAHYVGPWNNRCLFMALTHAIQHFFVTRTAPYPAERTLLATGILEAAVRSRAGRQRIATPHLDIAYQPRDFRALREMGESWKIVTEAQKETNGFAARPFQR
jgi:hypothetical protein